jgi:ferredoxin
MDKRSFLARDAVQTLIDVLRSTGFRVIGPRALDGVIQFAELDDAGQLPRGIRDRQAPGEYRLEQTGSPRCFLWANGPQAIKPHAFAPTQVLWRTERRSDGTLAFEDAHREATQSVALLGVRACDLAALALQDSHFLGKVADPCYAVRREGLFLVAVHCSHPAATCFCASTGDGPSCSGGFDIALHELDEGYLVEAGSTIGETILEQLPTQAASEAQCAQADREIVEAAAQQRRALPAGRLRERLFDRLDHPRWHAVGERCLSCGNCTSVCPTCFCHSERDAPQLGGAASEHLREWDSCFSEGHSYLHGFVVRPQTEHRYRQWLTHKLGSWHEQYGRSGCVGCGRCISWCPVGIDITEEARAICGEPPPRGPAS